MRKRQLHLAPGILCVLFLTAVAQACSVCQGDPGSPLVEGAKTGVLLMVGVTYAVVLGMVAMPVMWIVRARRLQQLRDTESEIDSPPSDNQN